MKRKRSKVNIIERPSQPKRKKNAKLKKPIITSEEQYKLTASEIAKRNKQRSKAMERYVAKYLGGRRQPSSGAFNFLKGDGIAYLPSGGFYLIECKLTDQDTVAFSKHWFERLLKDVQSMGAKFGILVFHFHNARDYLVFVPQRFAPETEMLETNQQRKTILFSRNSYRNYLGRTIEVEGTMYSCMTLPEFKEMINEQKSGE